MFKGKVFDDSEGVCRSVVQPNFRLKKQWSSCLVSSKVAPYTIIKSEELHMQKFDRI